MVYIWAYPAVRKIFSSTGRMIETGLNTHHSFWTRGTGLVQCFYLPSLEQDDPERQNSKQRLWREAKSSLATSPAQPSASRCPSSLHAGTRRKELTKQICREATGLSLAGLSVGDVPWGRATPQHRSPPALCLSPWTRISLHREPAPAPWILFRFVLAVSSEFRWATSLRPKSAPTRRFAHLRKSKKSLLARTVLMLLGL